MATEAYVPALGSLRSYVYRAACTTFLCVRRKVYLEGRITADKIDRFRSSELMILFRRLYTDLTKMFTIDLDGSLALLEWLATRRFSNCGKSDS